MIRLGIMGLGYIGRVHLAAARSLGVVVTAVASRRPPEPGELPEPAQVFRDYDQFLRDAPVDAVVLCLPTWLHERYALAALAAGRHVLCEKPLALDAAAARRMVGKAEQVGRILMAAQVLRFWPHYARVRAAIAEGLVGRVREINACRLSAYPNWAQWFRDPEKSGGALLDLQIHDLDFLYSLMGAPRQIRCTGSRSSAGAWDSVHTSVSFDSALATIEASFALPASWPFRAALRVLGELGALEYSLRAPANIAGRDTAVEEVVFYPSAGDPRVLAIAAEDPYRAQLKYFLDCVGDARPPARCPPRDSVAVLQWIEACRQSIAEDGQPISLIEQRP